jgi:hypothetical protein
MDTWTEDELRKLAGAEEFSIASRRRDGSMRPYVTIWGVRAGNEIYIRSAYGSENPWYVRALASGEGRVRAGGVERDVEFARVDEEAQGSVDAAYHAKYDRHGPRIVGTVVGDHAHAVTLRLVPREETTG